MFTEKDIEKIASLARMNLTEKEKEKFQSDLSSILDYVKELNQVNTDSVRPLYQATGIDNSFRKDESRSKIGASLDLVSQAPHKENNLIKVKSVLNSNE